MDTVPEQGDEAAVVQTPASSQFLMDSRRTTTKLQTEGIINQKEPPARIVEKHPQAFLLF